MVGLRACAVAGLLLLAGPAAALAPLPASVGSAAAVWDGSSIHIVGGVGADGQPREGILQFDTRTNTAVAAGAGIGPAAGAAAVWTGSHVAVFGGIEDGEPSRLVRLYDPALGTVDVLPSLLPEHRGVTAVWDGQRAYLFLRSSLPLPVYAFDPASGTLAPAGGALWEGLAGVAAVHDGRYVWLFGGLISDAPGAPLLPSPIVWRYDPDMDRVEPVGQLPYGLAWAGAVWDGRKALLVGGHTTAGVDAANTLLAFDPATKRVSVAATLPADLVGAAPVWAGHLYSFGGGAWLGGPIGVAGTAPAEASPLALCFGCSGGTSGGVYLPVDAPPDVVAPEEEAPRPPECDCDPPPLKPSHMEADPPMNHKRQPVVVPGTELRPVDGCAWQTRLDGIDIACDPDAPVGDDAQPFHPTADAGAHAGTPPGPVSGLLAIEIAVLVAVGAFLWRHRRFIIALPLFTRLQKDSLLDHPVRAQIHTIVEAEPGIHYNELLRRAASGRGALDHHLKALVDHGLLKEHATTGYRCYFIAGSIDRRVMAARAALRADLARELLENLCRHPGDSIGALASRTGVTPSAAAYHLHRFADVGLVELTRKGRRVEVHPGPVASQVLATA